MTTSTLDVDIHPAGLADNAENQSCREELPPP